MSAKPDERPGQRVLTVAAGLLGRMPAPTIERYSSAQPWPGDRFA